MMKAHKRTMLTTVHYLMTDDCVDHPNYYRIAHNLLFPPGIGMPNPPIIGFGCPAGAPAWAAFCESNLKSMNNLPSNHPKMSKGHTGLHTNLCILRLLLLLFLFRLLRSLLERSFHLRNTVGVSLGIIYPLNLHNSMSLLRLFLHDLN
jgi:hypothetical protein